MLIVVWNAPIPRWREDDISTIVKTNIPTKEEFLRLVIQNFRMQPTAQSREKMSPAISEVSPKDSIQEETSMIIFPTFWDTTVGKVIPTWQYRKPCPSRKGMGRNG
jgi:hypothetical protein